MNGPGPKPALAPAPKPLQRQGGLRLQRQCDCGTHSSGGGECEACKKKKLQRSPDSSSAPGLAPGSVHEVLSRPGLPLDRGSRAFLEPRFGRDFSGVRVHTDGPAAASARSVGALAYTVGQQLVFAEGQYQPRSARGLRLLAHELAHTVQQGDARPAPQAKLAIDAAGSPLEAAADQAAEAALAGSPMPALVGSGPTLSRQVAESRTLPEQRGECRPPELANIDLTHIDFPTAEAPTGKYTVTSTEDAGENLKRVRISTGKSYLVRRNPVASMGEVPKTTLNAKPGLDKQDVWLEVEFCRGATEGTIRVGANVPDQAIQLVLNTLTSGGDVKAAWAKANITPTVSGSVKSGHWSVDASVHTTVDTKGKDTGVGGEVSVGTDVGGGHATVGGSVDSQSVGNKPLGGVQGQVFFRYEWGKSQTPPKCPTEKLKAGFTYECQEEQEVAKQGTQSVTRTEEQDYNLFFKYAKPVFEEDRNTKTWQELLKEIAKGGYQVARIEGWASPEGPMGPGKGGFVGNEVLSQQRADAVRKRLLEKCNGAPCLAPGAEVVGKGERLDPTDEEGKPQDIKGKPLEEHVDQAFPAAPGEASVRTPELTEALAKTPSLHARAETIYPELRRAVLTLRKSSGSTDKCTYTVHQDAYLASCPDDIRKAAYPDSDKQP